MRHNFVVKLAELEKAVPPDKMMLAEVDHDRSCGFLRGTWCDCDPKIDVRLVDTMAELKEGATKLMTDPGSLGVFGLYTKEQIEASRAK